MLSRTLRRRVSCAALLGWSCSQRQGCSSGTATPPGLTISGPGLQTGKPPWPPEYKQLTQRLQKIGIPPGGKETFHIHAMLHIYVPMAASRTSRAHSCSRRSKKAKEGSAAAAPRRDIAPNPAWRPNRPGPPAAVLRA